MAAHEEPRTLLARATPVPPPRRKIAIGCPLPKRRSWRSEPTSMTTLAGIQLLKEDNRQLGQEVADCWVMAGSG